MLRNITLSADSIIIDKARAKATQQRRSLNDAFRQWLAHYASGHSVSESYYDLMQRLSHVRAGRHFSRDEMNER
jgi:hypothetical protein